MKSKYVRLRTPHLFTITYYLFTAAKGRLQGTGKPVHCKGADEVLH